MENRKNFTNKLIAVWLVALLFPVEVFSLEVVEIIETTEPEEALIEELVEEVEEPIEEELEALEEIVEEESVEEEIEIEEEEALVEELEEVFSEEIVEIEELIPEEEFVEELSEELVEEGEEPIEEELEALEEIVEEEIVEEEIEIEEEEALVEELEEVFSEEIVEVEELEELLDEEALESSELTEELSDDELTESLGEVFSDELLEPTESAAAAGTESDESEVEELIEEDELVEEEEFEELLDEEEEDEPLILLEEPLTVGAPLPENDDVVLAEELEEEEEEAIDVEVLYELDVLDDKSSNLVSLENDFRNRLHFLDGSAENRWVFFGDEIEGLSFPLLEEEEEMTEEPGLLRSLFKGNTQSELENFVKDLFSTDEFLELYFAEHADDYHFEFLEAVNANSGWYITVNLFYKDVYVEGGDFLFLFDRSLRLVALKQASPNEYSAPQVLSKSQVLNLITAELAPEVETERLSIQEMSEVYIVSPEGRAQYMYEVLLSDGYSQRILLFDPELNQIERVEDLYLFENLPSGASELQMLGTYYDSQSGSTHVHNLPSLHFHSDGNKYKFDDDGFLDLIDFDPQAVNELFFKNAYLNLFDDDISVDTVASFKNIMPVYLEEEGRAKLFFQYLLDDESSFPLQNAYYNLSLIDDYFRSKFDFSGTDLDVHVNSFEVDQAWSGCSAYYNKLDQEVHLGRGGCGYENKALSEDILYHEYGHYVLNSVRDTPYVLGEESAALQEAIADYFTASFTDDPNIAEGFIDSPRDLTNDLEMSDWRGDSHYDSQILSGALWDLREVIGRKTTDKLVYAALYGGHISYEDFLYQLIIEDDRDLNLADGTPHLYPILWAFERHGIGPGFEAFTQGLDLQSLIDEWQPAIEEYAGEDQIILYAAPDSITLTLTNTGIDFGYLPSASVSTSATASTISIDTDASSGFEVYLSATGDGANAGLFDPVSATLLPSTASSSMSSGVNGFAVYLENPTTGVTIEEGFDNDGTSDLSLSLSSQLVFSMSSKPTSIESADLRYMAGVSPITTAGNYNESINIFVIGRF